ncbi:hypothetical protein OUZ56_009808 [Daphnia magna]|uniref:Uncharacterized protein n=1 Tax=Daphnia magna TaxID=35525 RepID=A0ABR0AH15_9CRUS|nr:hypothetical protein OUZ56_009808 [Daphnia magna]
MDKNCDAIFQTGKNGLPIRKQKYGHPYNNTRGPCYILILPIQQQFNYFLDSGGMKLREETNRYDGATRGDVQSGDCYREKIDSDVTEECTFTLQLNVDGAQCFKKSKFGFWPFMGVINDIPYEARRTHMLLMSLWFGNKKPPGGPFLDTSIAELKQLGEMIKVGRGSARAYPEATTNPTFPLRTIEQHEEDLMAISILLEKEKAVHRIRGPSPFLALTNFDNVKAQVPDYLHSVCQGVIKCLVRNAK